MTLTTQNPRSCCVVYTTDRKYLFPTLVSAMQARQQSSLEIADVVIIAFGLDQLAIETFSPICRAENIILKAARLSSIDGHTAMMARFFLNQLLPEHYTDYLYLDGDVHILHSLDSLLSMHVPDGCFLAANDPMTFLLEDSSSQTRELRRHLEAIGLSEAQALAYFNSGVLRINRKGWDMVGKEAAAYMQANPDISRFPDQDVLNLIAGDRRLPMSLAWNYPVFLRNSRVEDTIEPKIKHFMSNPKPWHGAFPPWTEEACQPYHDAMQRYPSLALFNLKMPKHRKVMYQVQQRGKQLTEYLTWGWSERRDRILTYERNCSTFN